MTPERLTIWRTETEDGYDGVLHDLLSPYTESFYLPLLGPTGVAILRKVAREIPGTDHDGITTWDTEEQAACFGVPAERFHHALVRLARLNIGVSSHDDDVFGFPLHLHTLPGSRIAKLPAILRAAHDLWALRGDDRDAGDRGLDRIEELEL